MIATCKGNGSQYDIVFDSSLRAYLDYIEIKVHLYLIEMVYLYLNILEKVYLTPALFINHDFRWA